MFSKTTLLALAAASAVQAAAPQGFNYGSKMGDTPRDYNSFKTDFEAAQKLNGAPGTFNSARLYTMLDAKDGTSVIPALQAAIDTKTYLLLGLWMSGDKAGYDNEVNALQTAIKTMPDLAQYIVGISVGSEDLYRISPTGLAAPDAAPGNGPDVIVQYIKKVRDSLSSSSAWSKIPVGHVDTWTAWVNGSNSAVIDNSDFLGVDAYPYWQNTQANAVSNGASLFNEAIDNTKGVSNGKPVWITETGWAVSGPTEGQAVAGDNEAQQYWDDVACPNLGNTPTFWYTLFDGILNDPKTPSFSVTNQTSDGKFTPRFDLSCSGHTSSNTTSTSSSSSSGSSTGSASTSTGTGSSSSGSGASNGTYTGTPSQPSSTAGSSSGGYGSGSGSSSSGSGSGSGSSSPGSGSSSSGSSSNGTAPISTTNGAGSLSFSLGSAAAIAAAVVAFL